MTTREGNLREAFRPLAPSESAILGYLLSIDAPGIEELRAQVPFVEAARWDCGCASFSLRVDRDRARRSSVLARPALEAQTRERDDVTETFDLLLWVEDGWLSGVEIVDYVERHGVDSPDEIPPPELWDAPQARGEAP